VVGSPCSKACCEKFSKPDETLLVIASRSEQRRRSGRHHYNDHKLRRRSSPYEHEDDCESDREWRTIRRPEFHKVADGERCTEEDDVNVPSIDVSKKADDSDRNPD
jgi:hypothetical protein